MSKSVVGVPKEIKDMEGRVSMQPDGVAELVHHGHEVVVEAGAGGGRLFHRRGVRGGRRPPGGRARGGLLLGGPDREGQGAHPRGVRPFPGGTAAIHLPAPGGGQGPHRILDAEEDRRDSLRDGRVARRQPAASHPDERGCGEVVGPGGGASSGESAGRGGAATRGRARDAGGEGHHHRGRGLGHRGSQDSGRDAGDSEGP